MQKTLENKRMGQFRAPCFQFGGFDIRSSCRAMKIMGMMICIVLMLITAPFSRAQNSNAGDIRGTVTDPSGAVIPGVTISIRNMQTGVRTTVQTNAAGLYDAVSLLPGTYTLRFSKSGFEAFVRSGITLGVNPISVNAHLSVGSVAQQVTVSGDVASINTESGEQNQMISSQQITEIPTGSADWTHLTELLPSTSGKGGSGAQFDGVQAYQTNFLIDGGGATLPASQNITRSTPLDAISQIQTISSNFNAEYGNGSSVINVITKSGTNEWHGSLYEYNQNDFFNARNYFSPTPTRVRWNLFGGTVGGPVLHDKLFFFFTYQGNRIDNSSLLRISVPTAAVRGGDFSDPAFPTIYQPSSLKLDGSGHYVRTPYPGNKITDPLSPVSLAIQKYIPMPNRPGLYLNYQTQFSHPFNGDMYLGRVDYQITSNNRLSGSFTYEPGSYNYEDPRCPAQCYLQKDDQPTAQITDVWTHSSNLVNEFRSSFASYRDTSTSQSAGGGIAAKLGLQNAAQDVFPGTSTSGPVAFTGLAPGLAQHEDEYTYTFSDAVTYVHGKHIFKFGGEYDRLIDNATSWPDDSSGNFSFDGSSTRCPYCLTANGKYGFDGGEGYADFLLGDVHSWSLNVAPETGERSRNVQMFAQDSYKLRPNLTLDFGLRYMIAAGWSEAHNNLGNFNPAGINPVTNTPGTFSFAGVDGYPTSLMNTKYNGVQPRFSFSWAPTETWAVRGGYGIFDTMWGISNYTGTANFGRFGSLTGTAVSTDQINPALNWNDPLPTATTITKDSFNGASYNNQNISYQNLDTPIPYVEQYSLSIQHQLPAGFSLEVAYVGTVGKHLLFGRDINQVPENLLGGGQQARPFPQYKNIFANTNDGFSNYNAGQFSLHKQPTHGYSFDLIYSYSRTFDSGTGTGWDSYAGMDNWQYGSPAQNYGPATYDTPQVFKGDFVVLLPVGKGRWLLNRSGVLNAALGGWELSSFFAMQSGNPFTPEMGGANTSGGLSGAWRPNRIGSGKLAHQSINEWFNIDDFVAPAAYTFGNSGRNFLRGPDYKNMDLTLAKNFTVPRWEQGKLQLRLDAFNALNHTNFGNPNASIGTKGAGIISSAGSPRTLQLGARFTF